MGEGEGARLTGGRGVEGRRGRREARRAVAATEAILGEDIKTLNLLDKAPL